MSSCWCSSSQRFCLWSTIRRSARTLQRKSLNFEKGGRDRGRETALSRPHWLCYSRIFVVIKSTPMAISSPAVPESLHVQQFLFSWLVHSSSTSALQHPPAEPLFLSSREDKKRVFTTCIRYEHSQWCGQLVTGLRRLLEEL